MNIVVCLKQVPDVRMITYDLNTDSLQNVSYVLNSRDIVAMEEAVRMKERQSGVSVSAVTVGPPDADALLRICLGMGADEAIRIWDPVFKEFDAYATSTVLCRFIRQLKHDLILCGSKSDDEESSFVGACIGEQLRMPFVSRVVKLEIPPGKCSVVVERRLERGDREIVECPTPAVLAVEKGLNEPRYVSLGKQRSALKIEIVTVDASRLALKPQDMKPMTKRLAFSQSKPRLKKGFIIDSSLPASERVALILSGGVRKTERIVEKRPPDLARELVDFLVKNRIV